MYICITFCLYLYLPTDTWVAPAFWAVVNDTPGREHGLRTSTDTLLSILLGIDPAVGLLGHAGALVLIF